MNARTLGMKCFLCVNSISRLCLRLRDTALEFNLPFDMCRWLVEGEDDRPRGTGQVPSAFDQQAFAKAVGIAATAIAQTGAAGSHGGVDDIRGIQEMGAGTKRKGDQHSSSSRKKQKALGS